MDLQISVSAKRVLWTLVAIVVVLHTASILMKASMFYVPEFPLKHEIKAKVSVGSENNIPSWYSACAILLASALTAVTAMAKRAAGDRWARHWAGLAAVMLLLSVDEISSLHELVGDVLYRFMPTTGYLYYVWVVPGMIFVLGFVIVFSRFLLRLHRPTATVFVLGGAIFVFGAIGLEMIAARWDHLYGTMGFAILTAVEEFCEMIGIVLYIYAILRYMALERVGLQIRFPSSPR